MPRTKKAKLDSDAQELSATVTTSVSQTEEKPSAAKRTAKGSMEKEVLLQYGGGEWSVSDLEEKVIAAYVAEGHRRGRISKLTVYLKPEERKIYYVINDKITGSTEFE